MVVRGLKRKLHGVDDIDGSVWERQLQSILDISLDKFQRDQALVDPSLLRSVLISNTLRQVQCVVRSQVEPSAATRTESALKKVPGIPQSPAISASHVGSHTDGLGVPLCPGDPWLPWSSEEEFSLSAAISSILRDLDEADDTGSAVLLRPPLGAVENLCGNGSSSSYAHVGGCRPGGNQERCRLAEAAAVTPSCSTPSQDPTLEKMFLDMDSVFGQEAASLGAQAVGMSTTPQANALTHWVRSSLSDSQHQSLWSIQEQERSTGQCLRA